MPWRSPRGFHHALETALLKYILRETSRRRRAQQQATQYDQNIHGPKPHFGPKHVRAHCPTIKLNNFVNSIVTAVAQPRPGCAPRSAATHKATHHGDVSRSSRSSGEPASRSTSARCAGAARQYRGKKNLHLAVRTDDTASTEYQHITSKIKTGQSLWTAIRYPCVRSNRTDCGQPILHVNNVVLFSGSCASPVG